MRWDDLEVLEVDAFNELREVLADAAEPLIRDLLEAFRTKAPGLISAMREGVAQRNGIQVKEAA